MTQVPNRQQPPYIHCPRPFNLHLPHKRLSHNLVDGVLFDILPIMDTNNNRLFLNFGNNNDRLVANDRAYPTTPSTFPQPVYPPQQGAQQGGGLHPPQQQYAGYGGADYFVQQNQYQQYQQQPLPAYRSAQNAGYQPRSGTPGNDPNVGLAQQFSQLGGGVRGSPYGAMPSSQRPRTANAPGQAYGGGYANAPPMPTQNAAPASEFQIAPERNPDKYGPNANNNQKRCSQLAADFFKDSVKRARERNQR